MLLRNVRTQLLALIALLALAGCASDGQVGARTPVTVVADTSTPVEGKTTIRCHKETRPGSNLIQNVCETERPESDRQMMQFQIMNAVQKNQGVHMPVGPG